MCETKVEITVHELVNEPGHVVRLIASDTRGKRTTKLPVDDVDEAAALAESIARYVQVGGDLTVFFPDDDADTASDAPGAP